MVHSKAQVLANKGIASTSLLGCASGRRQRPFDRVETEISGTVPIQGMANCRCLTLTQTDAVRDGRWPTIDPPTIQSQLMFGYETHSTDSALERLLGRYDRKGTAVQVDFRMLVRCFSSAERATHLIHPYPAKLLTHIPYFFLGNSLLSRKGDLVADPFCGSGTVLVESQLAGRAAIGADVNPLARLISRVKTTPIPSNVLDDASQRLFARIPERPVKNPPNVINITHWFYPHVIHQLQCLTEAIAATKRQDVRDFFSVCLSNCVKRVSLADPRLSVPVKLTPGQYPPGHHLREKTDDHLQRLRRVNVFHVFRDILAANRARLASLETVPCQLPVARIVSHDARNLSPVGFSVPLDQYRRRNSPQHHRADSTVQLVITSPPYPGAQKYIRSCSLSLGWLGLCRADELLNYKHQSIGREEFRQADHANLTLTGLPAADTILRRIYVANPVRAAIASTYLREMRQAIGEISRIMKPRGHLVLVAANNRISGSTFRTPEYLQTLAEQAGFRVILALVDNIRSRGLMTKRNKTASIIASESVLVFVKDGRPNVHT